MRMNTKLDNRNSLAFLCNAFKFKTAIEIGTHQGVFADQFLEQFFGKLTCIDSWIDPPTNNHEIFYPGFVEQNLGREFDRSVANLVLKTKYGDRVTLICGRSPEIADIFTKKVDFIYIDGDHRKKSVEKDLEAWWPKLRRGGIFAGHDYDKSDKDVKGVVKAVDEHIKRFGLKLYLTGEEHYPSWYVRKI